jgi:hypothetical protein
LRGLLEWLTKRRDKVSARSRAHFTNHKRAIVPPPSVSDAHHSVAYGVNEDRSAAATRLARLRSDLAAAAGPRLSSAGASSPGDCGACIEPPRCSEIR